MPYLAFTFHWTVSAKKRCGLLLWKQLVTSSCGVALDCLGACYARESRASQTFGNEEKLHETYSLRRVVGFRRRRCLWAVPFDNKACDGGDQERARAERRHGYAVACREGREDHAGHQESSSRRTLAAHSSVREMRGAGFQICRSALWWRTCGT